MSEIILHLGAHRTASTYVQGVLGKNAALLAAHGIFAPKQEITRATLTESLGSALPGFALGRVFERFLEMAGAKTARSLIISDENMPGFLNNIFAHARFYPETRPRLQRLRQLLPVAPRRVLFNIRPYETFFASAYGRWLSPVRPVLPRAVIAETVLGLQRGWADIVAEIAGVFPESELVISEYNSDDSFGPRQLHRILGPLADELEFTSGYRWNRGMSGYQTMRYERALQEGAHNGLDAESIRALNRGGQPPLSEDFWDGTTRDTLRRRYNGDCARLSAQYPAFVRANRNQPRDAGGF